ncbi:MAG TPA: sugar transferase [Caulobacterales bacterium]|nr:sugar transferase [Caulobacterales bacterium]
MSASSPQLPQLGFATASPTASDVAPLHGIYPPAGMEYRLAIEPVGGALKRAFDIVASALALALLTPLFICIAIQIKLDSPGPVFFRQRRAGFRGRVFRIYKFRTMSTLEDGRNVAQAVQGDARVTQIGRTLRKFSLDELPQLINVLRGEMSLVGPRPHAILHEHEFRRFDLAYTRRRFARPGITGLAQVSGARGVTDTEEKVARRIALDLAYVNHWSIWLDLMIMLRTVAVFLRDPAAF